jgi:hypothetical protein
MGVPPCGGRLLISVSNIEKKKIRHMLCVLEDTDNKDMVVYYNVPTADEGFDPLADLIDRSEREESNRDKGRAPENSPDDFFVASVRAVEAEALTAAPTLAAPPVDVEIPRARPSKGWRDFGACASVAASSVIPMAGCAPRDAASAGAPEALRESAEERVAPGRRRLGGMRG